MRDYILKETGITISPFLELYIYETSRLETANYDVLMRITKEYKMIHKFFNIN